MSVSISDLAGMGDEGEVRTNILKMIWKTGSDSLERREGKGMSEREVAFDVVSTDRNQSHSLGSLTL